MAVQYAKERFTFGRAIGSYQAIKHGLTEVLRRQENARSLLYYTGWAFDDQPEEFALAASAARSAAGSALDFAARQNIITHGGIGATWEHDAPLFFRRAQLSGGCSAERAMRPTAWPRSCSRRPDLREQLPGLSRRSALADGQEVQRTEEQAWRGRSWTVPARPR